MPLFFLHFCDNEGYHPADEGLDCADLAAARGKAIVGLRDTLCGQLEMGHLNIGAYIDIEDGAHHHLETVQFTDAIKITSHTASRPSP